MARRIFFSFDHDGDLWRASQVRNSDGVAGREVAGFFDPGEHEEAKKQGREGMERLIQRHLKNTSVTVVLIGAETANRPWVKYEIEQSIAQKNGLLGIYIGHMRGEDGRTPTQGLKPMVPPGVEFPAYSWDRDLERLTKEIEAAGKRSDALRRRSW
ncbi:MAG: TIR-like domain-containing protein [Acidobacteria bacterium]|nr:MAG: TIR-like domain-containing protein [Acidobacteriota bacterium]